MGGMPEPRRRAFTLLELLVVLATVSILAAMLLPALARAKPSSHGMQCMSNQKQLTLAWLLYADDNGGALPPNVNGGATKTPPSSWVHGWLNFSPDNTDNTNLQFLANGVLGPYLQMQTKAFKCPADIYTCVEGNRASPRVRSVSMNGYIEGNAYLTAKAGLPPDASIWYNGYFCAYNKVGDIIKPVPAALFVFLDEHPDSINDGWFITDMPDTGAANQWVDLPASYHNRGCGFSFADGHSTIHKWLNPVTCQPVTQVQGNTWPSSFNNADILWMQQHASAPYGSTH
jgi:prepilin-type N-terminal cleavage/methylation domain-containing protein/prepilin-type processing-associated H-X9-DG protein